MSDIPEREVGPGTPPSTAARTVPYIPAPSRPSPPAPMPSIPGYELRDVLGSGGMGIVYRAVQVALNREVALKVIKPEYLTDPQAVARFKQELRAAAQLTSHPNVVMVYDAGPEGPLHYFSMELVPGIDLKKLLNQVGALTVRQACKYALDVARGLQHAHKRLVHRDIKPDNLIVVCRPGERPSMRDQVRIIDFGLARLTEVEAGSGSRLSSARPGAILGTADYMAPEQADNPARSGPQADLYSLGCTLYHMLTGQVPFPGGQIWEKLARHRDAEPVPVQQLRPDVPAVLADLVRRLMAKCPADRFTRPEDVFPVLEAVVENRIPSHGKIKEWKGHTGPVAAVAVAPNGRWLVSGGADRGLIMWDVTSANPLGRLDGHDGPVTAVAISPDSEFVLSGSADRSVRLWRAADRAELRRFDWHTGPVTAVCFSPDGRWVASGGADGTVRQWLPGGGWAERPYEAHEGAVTAVAFSPDSQSIASGSADGVVQVWRLGHIQPIAATSGPAAPLHELPDRRDRRDVRALGWSRDGRYLVYAKDRLVYVWHPATDATTALLADHTDPVLAVACSRDGRSILSAGSEGAIRRWEFSSGRKVDTLGGAVLRLNGLAMDRDGGFAVSGGEDGVVRRHDLPTQPEPEALYPTSEAPQAGPVRSTKTSVNTRVVRRLATLEGHAAPVSSVRFAPHSDAAFAPHSDVVVSAGWDHTVRLWDVQTGHECQRFIGHTAVVWKAIVMSDGQVLSAGQDGSIRLWDRHTAADLGRFPLLSASVNDIVLSWDESLVVSAGDEHVVHVWRVATGKVVKRFEGHAEAVTRVALSPDMKTLASCSRGGTIRVWDFRTGRLTRTLLERTAGVITRELTFSPDGTMLASGGWDGVVRLWETETGREIGRLPDPAAGEPEAVHAVAFSPNGEWLLTGSGGRNFRADDDFHPTRTTNAVRLWNVRSGIEVGSNTEVHTGPVTRVEFSPSGKLAVSSGYDRTVRLWTVPGDVTISSWSHR